LDGLVPISLKRGAAGVLALLVLALPSSAAADAGDLDLSFGGDGKVLTNATPAYDYASGLVVLSNGQIVTAGPASGARGRFMVVRYNNDGPRETSFGGDGIVFTNFTPRGDEAYDIALWNDKFVVAGTAAGSGGRFALARYNDNGTLDTSFSGDGKVTTDLSPGNDWAFSVAVQSDDRIVAAGHADREGGRFAVVRYNDDGTLDTTFSGDGKAYVNFTGVMDYVDEIALNDDGTILAAGIATGGNGGRFALARFEADGDLDTTFSGDGKLTTDFTPNFDGAFGVVLQGDDKIVAVGAAGRNVGLARYEPDGDLDPTFGANLNGKVVMSFTTQVDSADDVVLRPGGGVFIGGAAGLDRVDSRFGIAAFTASGVLDTSFGGDGKVITNMTERFDWALDVEIDPSTGKLVAGGIGANTQKSALARYETEN
jgi:uncharacterized delta-60 repeat protein